MPINVLFCIIMGYPPIQKQKAVPQRNIYMWFLVFTMLFSGGMVPAYILIYELNLLDSIWALILPSAVGAYNIILVMNYFKKSPRRTGRGSPHRWRGCYAHQWSIYVPLALPVIATVALFSFVGHWNAWFDASIYMESQSKIPLQTYIQQLVVESSVSSSLSPQEQMMLAEVSENPSMRPRCFVTMLPLLLIYPFVQRYFVQGIVIGSVKE